MAGETPRSHNLGKKKKRPNWQDDRSTDKYYGSANPSAVQRTHGDTVGRPGDPPKPVPVNKSKIDERNADKKYYANPPSPPTVQQSKAGRLPMPGGAPMPVGRAAAGRKRASDNVGVVRIETVETVRELMESLPGMLTGENNIVVEVTSSDLLRRARAKLDTMVTGQLISEELARDIRFSKVEQLVAPKLDLSKPPEPAACVALDNEQPIDIDAVLSGKVDISENFLDVAADPVPQEVDMTEDSEDADDDGDDFIAPTTASVETIPAEDSSSVETPADVESDPVGEVSPEFSSQDESAADPEAASKKRGRRSGRGTK